MHVVLRKAFIFPWKFMSHIPISYVGKDNKYAKIPPLPSNHYTVNYNLDYIGVCLIIRPHSSPFASVRFVGVAAVNSTFQVLQGKDSQSSCTHMQFGLRHILLEPYAIEFDMTSLHFTDEEGFQ
jgi:hypothetical protein